MGEKWRQIGRVLRKLGILRFGATTYTYSSGKDMPARALLDDVYDEEKDLVTHKDWQQLGRKTTRPDPEGDRFCRHCGTALSTEAGECTPCGGSRC